MGKYYNSWIGIDIGTSPQTCLENQEYENKVNKIEKNWITVTIPFNRINVVDYQINTNTVNKTGEKVAKKLNKSQLKIVELMRNNPNITTTNLISELKLGHTAIQNNLNKLQELGIIERIGAKRGDYWKVND